jgi:hypothetical protein
VLSVLSILLKQAVEWGVLEKMPCSIRLMRVTRTDAAFHDFDDYERLLNAAPTIDPRSYVIALGGKLGCGRARSSHSNGPTSISNDGKFGTALGLVR